jgi:membrane protease subunit (stomatin/prohibitin family)
LYIYILITKAEEIIMGFFKRQLLKVIKWEDNTKNQMVYKYPMEDRDEIMNGCELIVAESQVALLVSQGQIGDVYGPGSHKLTTGNMPVIHLLRLMFITLIQSNLQIKNGEHPQKLLCVMLILVP